MIPSDKALRLVHSHGDSDGGQGPPRWRVDIEVRVADPVVAAALSTVARSAVPSPWGTPPGSGSATTTSSSPDGSVPAGTPARFTRLLITDSTPPPDGVRAWSGVPGAATVLVVGPTPYDARWALQVMATLPVHGIVPAQRPAELAGALAALASGVVQVPASVVELARAAPALTAEQHTLAKQLVAGRSNPEICRAMGISQSGVKRRLSALFELFEVDNRVQAAAVAAGLGIRPAAR